MRAATGEAQKAASKTEAPLFQAASQEAAEMAAALVPFMAGRAAGHHADGGAAVRSGTGPSQLGTSAKR